MMLTRNLKPRTARLLAVFAAGLVLAACANQMEPAKKLLADVEAAVTAAGADAKQYVPEQVASVNQKLGELKAAPALLTEAKGLADAAAAKKKEVLEALGAQWTQLAADLPQAVSAVEARLATLAKTKKLPAGISKDGVAAAKAGLAEAKTSWDGAKAAFTAGNVQGALEQAKGVKAKLEEAAAKLGIAPAAKPAA
jgi:hypothetical protein